MSRDRDDPAQSEQHSALGEQTWVEVGPDQVLLVPLGSTEQHGPHLPLDTDTRIAVAVANGVAQQAGGGVVVAPAMAFGSSGEHDGFAGTLSIGTEALRHVLIELVRSASKTFTQVVFVNGHGGNLDAVTAAADQLRQEGHDVVVWWPSLRGDAHAGRTETSLMLAIAPELVRVDRAVAGNTAPVVELIAEMRVSGVVGVSANGVLGDPGGANAAEGTAWLNQLCAQLLSKIDRVA